MNKTQKIKVWIYVCSLCIASGIHANPTPVSEYITWPIEKVQQNPVKGMVIVENLNFRSYPSLTESKIYGKLAFGTEVTILYQIGDFYKVFYKDAFGFVYAPYILKITNTEVPVHIIEDVREIEDPFFYNTPMESMQVTQAQSTNLMGQYPFTMVLPGTISKREGVEIVSDAMMYVGYPYVYGGNNLETGVDCSGFTQQIMKHFNIELPRTAQLQSQQGVIVADQTQMQPGDLLFFGEDLNHINHVGIYVGETYMIHASTPETGIIINEITANGFKTIQSIRRMMR